MLTLEAIRRALQDRNIAAVSEATGIHPNTLYRIRDGSRENPSYSTIVTLSDYLRAQLADPAEKSNGD